MTKKEAKSCIGTIEMLQRLAYNIHGVMDVIDADNCKKIIKALEQEPVLDKIRSEIEQARDKLKKIPYDTGSDRNNAFIDNVLSANVEFCNDLLQILDKYKGESEEEE